METKALSGKLLNRNGILYPLLIMAAVAVIIFSIFGVATMTGLLPSARSSAMRGPASAGPGTPLQSQLPASASADTAKTPYAARAACGTCGVVESINAVEIKGSGTGLGMVAGGVTGLLLGNQIGRGNGNTAATIAGAAGGAYAGNEIEKNMKKSVRYHVRVHMNDGSYRTISQAHPPAFAVGERVKVVNGTLRAAS